MRRPFVEIAALVLVLVGLDAAATTYDAARGAQVAPVSTPQVVTGRVRATTPQWYGRRIVTRVVLDAETPGGTSSIEFLAPGGSIDGVAMRVSGAPRFVVGERTQVTVRPTASGLRLVGLGTGKVVLP